MFLCRFVNLFFFILVCGIRILRYGVRWKRFSCCFRRSNTGAGAVTGEAEETSWSERRRMGMFATCCHAGDRMRGECGLAMVNSEGITQLGRLLGRFLFSLRGWSNDSSTL